MGRHLHFKPGSFYRTDDISGLVHRAENTREQWDGPIVDDKVWSPRQPQDLVKGVKDIQSVPDARPLGQNVYVGPISVALTANTPVGATALPVQTIAGFVLGNKVGVILDTGSVAFSRIVAPLTGSTINIDTPLPYMAASGNLVTQYSENISV